MWGRRSFDSTHVKRVCAGDDVEKLKNAEILWCTNTKAHLDKEQAITSERHEIFWVVLCLAVCLLVGVCIAGDIISHRLTEEHTHPMQERREKAITKLPKKIHAPTKNGVDEQYLCRICLTYQKEYVNVPCGHTVYCGDCIITHASSLSQSNFLKCPLCREDVIEIIRFYK